MKGRARGRAVPGKQSLPADWWEVFDRRPILVCVAGPNGAGKTTFYHAHLPPAGLRFLNADEFARELSLEPYQASQVVTTLGKELVKQKASFVFETVFSDPVGQKVAFLEEVSKVGYTVLLCFIGLSGPKTSEQRVAMRATQGGHDVPTEKLVARYPRTLINLKRAIQDLPNVLVMDNEDLRDPYRLVAAVEGGRLVWENQSLPEWWEAMDAVRE